MSEVQNAQVMKGRVWDIWRPADLRSGRISRELEEIR